MLFIRKKYLEKIKVSVPSKNALILVGARQVGKSSLITMMINENIVEDELLLSGDELYTETFTPQSFYEYLDFRYDLSTKKTLIIDEAQKIENIGPCIKYLVDKNKEQNINLKTIISGSGSIKIFRGITESMVGRYDLIQVSPFSFEEFLEYNGMNTSKLSLERLSQPIFLEIKKHFEIYKTFGGYPDVVKAKTFDEKKEVFHRIYSDYLYKDIAFLLGEGENIYFEKFLQLFVSKIGSLIKAEEIIRELGIKKKLYDKFIQILESSFLFSYVKPFSGNIGNDIKKAQKGYMLDLGYISYILGFKENFGEIQGKIIENFVYNELCYIKKDFQKIQFWQNKNGTEVDFLLIDNLGKKFLPIEVKSGSKDIIPKSLQSFLSKYQGYSEKSIITSKDLYKVREEERQNFIFIPYILLFRYFLEK